MADIFHDSCFAMNTRFHALWWGADQEMSMRVFAKIRQALMQLEKILSMHDPESELYQFNKTAAYNKIKVSAYLFDVLAVIENLRRKTLGYFNPDYDNSASRKFDQPLMDFNASEKTVSFRDPGTRLDFGAAGKGLALEEINKNILPDIISNALISFGESSYLTRGRHPNGAFWPVGICDMHHHGRIVSDIAMNNHSLSISSTRRRSADESAGNYHIINPENGIMMNEDRTAVVKAASPAEAEALSTALLIAGHEERCKILDNFKPDEAIIIKYDKNFSPLIKRLI